MERGTSLFSLQNSFFALSMQTGVKSLSLTKGAGHKEKKSTEHGPQERVDSIWTTVVNGMDTKSNSCRLHLLNREILDCYIDDVFKG